jgi:hypothetical protein
MANTLKLQFLNDDQYDYCVRKFCNYFNFDGTRSERVAFMQQKIIQYIYTCVEAQVVRNTQDNAIIDGQTETATNLNVNTIVPSEQQGA